MALTSRPFLVLAAVMAVLVVQPSARQRRGIAETDLFRFVWVADPQMAPDGSRVAFVRVTVNDKKEQYESRLWVASTSGDDPPRPLTSGIRDSSPRWSRDGRHLAFVRAAEKDGKVQPPQIFVMTMGAGEPRAITDLPRGAGAPAWSPDGRAIAFTSTTTNEDLAAREVKSGEKARESDVRVITSAVYRANGIPGFGYTDPARPSHIWTIEIPAGGVAAGAPTRITSGEFGTANHQWSVSGAEIYFVANRRRDPYYYPNDSDLFAVARTGGEPRSLVSIDGGIGSYALSPDGRQVAFVGALHGAPVRSYNQADLWVASLDGGVPRNLTTGYDFDIGGGIGGDQRAPRGQHPAAPVWSRDGRSLFVRVGEQGDSHVARVDLATSRVEPIAKARQDIMSYTADDGARAIALVRSTPTIVGDLHVLDVASGRHRKLTAFNDELFAGLELTEPEEIWYTSFDGRKIQGWIQTPPSFDPARKYPLVLQIHGGPHSAYGNTFTHEFQWMASRGYVVLYTNPRGSSNYGQEFGNSIQFRYPGDDYKDLMAGVDEILKKGYVDEARMGVTGGSGGGLLTNWTVTQTTRFKAAVSQRDISDWSNFWYTADFTLFTPTWFRKAPFEDPADFAARSPITHVAKIQTPLMFILGDEDWRTPPAAGGEDLFRALKYLKRPTVMVRFPGENHELSRSGQPWHRVERLQHIVGWFDQWLLGKRNPTYTPADLR